MGVQGELPPGGRVPTGSSLHGPGDAGPHRGVARDGRAAVLEGAAAAAVTQLHRQVPMDLWVVTRAGEGGRVVCAAQGEGRFADAVRSGGVVLFEGESAALPAVVSPRSRPSGEPVALPGPTVEVALRRPDGSTAGWLHGVGSHGVGARAADGDGCAAGWAELVATMLTAVLAAESSAHEQELVASRALDLARHDQLTGLLNRRGWLDALEHGVFSRAGDEPVTVVVVDLDELKHLNDTAGHGAGDVALVRCAEVMRRTCRDDDVVARTGGDEFAVLARGALTPAGDLGRRLRAAFSLAGVAASLGSAQRRPGEDTTTLWDRADASMYAEKRRHRRRRGASPRDADRYAVVRLA